MGAVGRQLVPAKIVPAPGPGLMNRAPHGEAFASTPLGCIRGTARCDRHYLPQRLDFGCDGSGPRRQIMKWTGMYLVGFVILLGGVLAALWKLGVLATIGTTWTLIGIAIAIGVGIMIAVSNSGAKENIEIQRK